MENNQRSSGCQQQAWGDWLCNRVQEYRRFRNQGNRLNGFASVPGLPPEQSHPERQVAPGRYIPPAGNDGF